MIKFMDLRLCSMLHHLLLVLGKDSTKCTMKVCTLNLTLFDANQVWYREHDVPSWDGQMGEQMEAGGTTQNTKIQTQNMLVDWVLFHQR
jgi:hypothetical protein